MKDINLKDLSDNPLNENLNEEQNSSDRSFSQNSGEPQLPRPILRQSIAEMLPYCVFFTAIAGMQAYNVCIATQSNSPEEANAVALASSIANLACFLIVVGFMGGFEILGAEALKHNNPDSMGVYFHQSRIIGLFGGLAAYFTVFLFSRLAIPFFTTEKVDLNAFNSYISRYSLFIFPLVQSRACYNYLNLVGKRNIAVLSIICSIPVHIIAVNIMVNWLEIGLESTAYATILSTTFNALFLTVYMSIWKPSSDSIIDLSSACFENLNSYLAASLPSTAYLCSQWLAWEILCYIVLLISDLEYNDHVSIAGLTNTIFALVTSIFYWMFVNGDKLSEEKRLEYTKQTVKLTIISLATALLLFLILFFFLRERLLGLDLTDQEIIDAVAKLIPLGFLEQVPTIHQAFENNWIKRLEVKYIASGKCVLLFYCIQTILLVLSFILNIGLAGIFIPHQLSPAKDDSIAQISLIYLIYGRFSTKEKDN